MITQPPNNRSPGSLLPSLSGYQCAEDDSPGGGCILEGADSSLALASVCVHNTHFYSAQKHRFLITVNIWNGRSSNSISIYMLQGDLKSNDMQKQGHLHFLSIW